MLFLKLFPLLIILIIFILVAVARSYIQSLISPKEKKLDQMIACSECGIQVHESLVVKKYGASYCSEKCSSI
ncbi:hypothetical protein N8209_03700 [Gammaproteobacteria bacterium]|nr:hypothetical protein [Gammaproteobacteria bacterium]